MLRSVPPRCLAFLLVLVGLGCEPTIPEGRFECVVDEDCPPLLICDVRNERCYRPDGG